MSPKLTKTTQSFDDEAEEESAEGRKTKRKVPQQRVKPHEALVLLVDVGRTSAERSVPGEQDTDLERSTQIVDWVLSRKIFTESTDRFSLMFFGHESTTNDDHPNVYIHNEEFQTARAEWLHVLQNEVRTNPKCIGDYVDALYAALDALKVHIEGQTSAKAVSGATVTLVSNLGGLDDVEQVQEHVDSLTAGFNALGVDLLIVGPDFSEQPRSKAQQIGYAFAKKLLPKVGGSSYNFREGLSQLKLFIPKAIQPRGQPFDLELGVDFSIPVQMYLKNDDKPPLPLHFNPVGKKAVSAIEGGADAGKQIHDLRKVRRYETMAEGISSIKYGQIDQASDATFARLGQVASSVPTGRYISREQTTRGFRYGTTLVPFGDDIMDLVEYPREGKQLQLLQFVPRENILPQFIMNNCRYIMPAQGNGTAHTTFSALCQAMLDLGVVAICRYAYNVNSYPKMVCLIPKITKETNYPVLIHYILPFRDDLRYYNFPPVRPQLKKYQLDLMDSYIDSLMLYDEDSKKEQLRKGEVHDPRIQYECQLLRDRALHPERKGMKLAEEDRQKLLELLSPPKAQMDEAAEVLTEIREEFPVEVNEDTRAAAFRRAIKGQTGTLGQVDDSLKPIIVGEGAEEADEAKRVAKKEEE